MTQHRRIIGLALLTLGAAVVVSLIIMFSFEPAPPIRDPLQVSEVKLESVPYMQRDGYVGSDQCRQCHEDQFHSWHASFHRTMTQLAGPETILADFNDVALQIQQRDYHLTNKDGQFWVKMENPDPNWPVEALAKSATATDNANPAEVAVDSAPVNKRVVMVTGSHHQQRYWAESEHGNALTLLPFAFLIAENRWVPADAIFVMPPQPAESVRPGKWVGAWNHNCIQCHSTGGQPFYNETASIVDTRVGELGIACEACHGAGQQHVDYHNGETSCKNLPDHFSKLFNPATVDSKQASQICGQCHAVADLDDSACSADWLTTGFRF